MWHEPAYRCLRSLAEGTAAWAIPWPCIHEFIAITTHERVFAPPSPVASAIDQVDAWLESPAVTLLGESEDYWGMLRQVLQGARVRGPKVHDARIAALCKQHGIAEIWTADRDFNHFTGLKATNPLVS